MGFIKNIFQGIRNILQHTPLANNYIKFKRKRESDKQERLEKKLMPLRIAFYKEIIESGDLVFDIGANVGNRIDAFLACNANVIAIEPQPACVTILEQKFGSSIKIEPIGLSDSKGSLDMHIATDSTVSTFSNEFITNTKDRFKYTQWHKTIKVKIETLDSLISKYGIPKFCKIDVEGFEYQVLKGLHSPVPYLSFEYCVPEMNTNMLQCIDYLHTLSPSGLFNYSIGETMEWALNDWLNAEDFKKHAHSAKFINTQFGDIYFKSL